MEWPGSHGGLLTSPFSALPASSGATALWMEQVYSAREPITPCTLKGLWKAAQQPMSAHESDDWTLGEKCVCVCVNVWMCVCVCPIGEGCLHLNWVLSLGLGGLVVFNVTIAGQNDLCGASRHHSLNPPPPCHFQFSPPFTVKRELWLFSFSLSSLLSAPHIVKQASHWSRNVLKVFEFCEVTFNAEEVRECKQVLWRGQGIFQNV